MSSPQQTGTLSFLLLRASFPFASLIKLPFGADLWSKGIQYAYGYTVPQEQSPKITQAFHSLETAKRITTAKPMISELYSKYLSTPPDIESLPLSAGPKPSTPHPQMSVPMMVMPLPPDTMPSDLRKEPKLHSNDSKLPPALEFKTESPPVTQPMSKDLPHDPEPPMDMLNEKLLLLPNSSQTTESPLLSSTPSLKPVIKHPLPNPVSKTEPLPSPTSAPVLEMDMEPKDLPVPPAEDMSSGTEKVVTAYVEEPKKQPPQILTEHEEQLMQPKATLSPTPEPMKLPPFTSVTEAEETDIKSNGPAAPITVDCLQNADCNENEICMDEKCVYGCVVNVGQCVGNAVCVTDHHTSTCVCPDKFTAVALSNGGREKYDCIPMAMMVGAGGRQSGRRPSGSSGRLLGSHYRPLTPIAFHRGTHNYRRLAALSNEQLVSQERITTGVSRPSSRPISRPPLYDRQSSDPCLPNPCGPNTRCSLNNYGIALCRCIDSYVPDGNTINGCKPQCTTDGECPSDYRCRSQSCVRVCVQGACGVLANCKAQNHRALCTCPSGYRGDANIRCNLERPRVSDPPADLPVDPCNPSPCGSNAECRPRGERPVCSCPLGYEGDPLTNCRRGECIETNDCPSHQVCQRLKCVNPCDYDTCGALAECATKNHVPVCSCPRGYTGDPLTSCRVFDPQELCNPSPCGANTKCKVRNDRAVCSCFDNYIGSPLEGCRPECVSDGECAFNMACRNNICVNPCRDACGENAYCEVVNSRAVCTCPEYYLGDPYSRCYAECISHDECPSHRACIKLQCGDPCEGACGTGAICKVEDHKPICSCPKGYTGHPFESCRPFTPADLCNPNPCGNGADCTPGYSRTGENRPVCTCPTGYVGDPLVSCSKGECDSDSQCLAHQACYRYVCTDPCYTSVGSVCGDNAGCAVKNHKPVCSCPRGYDGDARENCYPGVGSYIPGRGRRS